MENIVYIVLAVLALFGVRKWGQSIISSAKQKQFQDTDKKLSLVEDKYKEKRIALKIKMKEIENSGRRMTPEEIEEFWND